jgi:hypothetical protein
MKHAAVIIAVLSLAVSVGAQGRTLREILLEESGPLEKRTNVNMPPVALDDLVRSADVIVLGVVQERSSYVSPDGTDVYTDLTLRSVQTLFPRKGFSSREPGAIETVVVTQLGGEVTIDGQRVRSIHADLLPLQRGTAALFLLNRSGDRLLISRNYLGVFGAENDEVRPLTQVEWFAAKYRGQPWSEFVANIASIVALR